MAPPPGCPNPYEAPNGQATHNPEERTVALVPRDSSWRGWPLAAGPDGIAICRRRQHVAAPHTYGGARAVETTSAQSPEGLLRPRNICVPSARPTPYGGCTVTVQP